MDERKKQAAHAGMEAAAARISLSTAHGVWRWDQVGEHEVAFRHWLFDPEERAVLAQSLVRELHPDLSDAEWADVLNAAIQRRDDYVHTERLKQGRVKPSRGPTNSGPTVAAPSDAPPMVKGE